MAEDHTVQQGESVMSIAEGNGFLWETLWNHPKNSQLKAKRVDPGVLMPGDVLHIPDRGEKKESAGVDQCHNFKRKGHPAFIRLALVREKKEEQKEYAAGSGEWEYREPDPKPRKTEPLANAPYAFYVDGKHVADGNTGGDGRIEAKCSPATRSAWAVLYPGTAQERTIHLNPQHMDPIEEIPGVCKRLYNLGFPCPLDAREVTSSVSAAIMDFQRQQGLQETGKPDAATKDRLKGIYGG